MTNHAKAIEVYEDAEIEEVRQEQTKDCREGCPTCGGSGTIQGCFCPTCMVPEKKETPAVQKEPTREEFASALAITTAIAGVIRKLGSVSSGHLYAHLCGKLSLEQYQSCIDLLVKVGMIKVENHLITWVLPR